ncbi:MAG TPA: nuclear transport factor 2 family protein [Steroidobacteraceae bacterium]|nr:nuclear transport factor 2 family protein [Steroidobacteraceae bacterium]
MERRFPVALAAAALGVCASLALSSDGRAADAPSDVQLQVATLEANVGLAEDLSRIEKLQRAYGYYVDKGLWEDLSQLFTENAVANYPAGVFIGRKSIREHLYMNVGGHQIGDIGLGNGRLYDHMNIQPVVHVDAGGTTAHGRWRAFAMFGSPGGGATWAEGVYEMQYTKENGVWKISKLDYYSGFGAPYRTGWAAPPADSSAPAARPRRTLAHPPDRERNMDCEGFPKACIAPFHYGNPGTTDSSHAWVLPDAAALAAAAQKIPTADIARRLTDLQHRTTLLDDAQKIENLQRIYGYYIDRALWDQAADLFAPDATIESGQQGVYVGKRRVRDFLALSGPQGLKWGWMNDHMQLQPIVDVAPDGLTARSRSRELDLLGHVGGKGQWMEGIYENTYVKRHGVWMFKSLHFYPTFITDYDKGWALDAEPVPTASSTLPPDRPPTEIYGIYPTAYVPPFHYPNPVTGEMAHYPQVGAPAPAIARAALVVPGGAYTPKPVRRVAEVLHQTETGIERVKDYYEIENLESAYGYYLDKDLWNDLANLFSVDGSMELAQRGAYDGRERVRAFLFKVFGRGKEGPIAGRLGNHMQLQPVIDVAPDGKSAKIRIRMFQQMSFGPRASVGAAVYENTAVLEDGKWKLRDDHTYNTLAANYEGGWVRSANPGVPGEDKELPPDRPPSLKFQMFPVVYDIPFHYANPVTGNSTVPPIVDGATPPPGFVKTASPPAAAARPPAPPAAVAAVTPVQGPHPQGMPDDVAGIIRGIGPRIDGVRTGKLYEPLQQREPYTDAVVTRDVAYGPAPRNTADIFIPLRRGPRKPVLVFVYGGGFAGGSKHTPGSPFYDNIGRWAAAHDMVGVTANYRLAPESQWPAGIEDMTALVNWVRAHIAEYGGDSRRIYLWGHSSGGAHVADYLAHCALTHKDAHVAGAILMSAAVYDLGHDVSVWKAYYGDDPGKYARESSLPGLLKSPVPLLVTDAELDPQSFQQQADELTQARKAAGRPVQRLHVQGHSHLSEAYAIGTADDSVSGPVLKFVRTHGAQVAASGQP